MAEGMKPYYQDESVTIYNADCRDVLPTLDKVDLVLTDPPYGVALGTQYNAKETRRGVGLVKQAYMSYEDTYEQFIEIVVPAVVDSLKLSDRGMVFCAWQNIWDFPRADVVSAIHLPAGQGLNRWGRTNLATLLLYGTAPDLNLGAKNTVLRSTAHAEPSEHPCPKPLAWVRWAVALGSRTGETVLDPFMGSGTTLRAAKDRSRKAIGIEIEERYCEIAANRMSQLVMELN